MLDLFLGPDDAAVALLLALGVPALILAPWVFVRTLMDWLRVADTTARVGGAAYAAAARVTSRAINNTWRTFLCLALLVTSWALTWRAVDEFAYERLLELDLTWAQRLHYLLVGTPDGYTAPTAAYIAIGTAGTWLLFLLVRSSLGFASRSPKGSPGASAGSAPPSGSWQEHSASSGCSSASSGPWARTPEARRCSRSSSAAGSSCSSAARASRPTPPSTSCRGGSATSTAASTSPRAVSVSLARQDRGPRRHAALPRVQSADAVRCSNTCCWRRPRMASRMTSAAPWSTK